MKKKVSIACFLLYFLFTGKMVWAQVFTNPITGTNPNTSNPYTIGQTFNSNITVSGIGRGSSIVGNNANNRYNADTWPAVFDQNAYFTFTMTPNPNYSINFQDFVYSGTGTGSGPGTFAFRSSIDNFTSNIGSASASGTTISLSATAYQNISSAITFRLYGWGAGNSAGTYGIDNFTFNGTVVLPIELTSFTARISDKITILDFTTATETNNAFFYIERSGNGRDFSELGKIAGAGTTREPQSYTFTDENPLSGANYYRLRQIDYDGSESFSTVVNVDFGKSDRLAIAPSPATDRIRILLEEAYKTDARWNVFDSAGREVLSGNWEAETAENELDVNALPEGMYTFRLVVGSAVQVKQFRKL